MSVWSRAWDALGHETAGVEGHLAELDVLAENAPGADNITIGMWGQEPCVCGSDAGCLVVASEARFAREPGPVTFRRYGSSFILAAGAVEVAFLGRRQCEMIDAATRSND